ncbi:hypothetical protein J3459_022517 [Metarhizium acridum]|nr:hypothetical protein J3459_022517 [Metarhizium acridum]
MRLSGRILLDAAKDVLFLDTSRSYQGVATSFSLTHDIGLIDWAVTPALTSRLSTGRARRFTMVELNDSEQDDIWSHVRAHVWGIFSVSGIEHAGAQPKKTS